MPFSPLSVVMNESNPLAEYYATRKQWDSSSHVPSAHEMTMKAAKDGAHALDRYRPYRDDCYRFEIPGPNSPLATGRKKLSYGQEMYKSELETTLRKAQSAARTGTAAPPPWNSSCHVPDSLELQMEAARTLSNRHGRYRPPRSDVHRLDIPGPNSALFQGRAKLSYKEEMYKDELLDSLHKAKTVSSVTSRFDLSSHVPDAQELAMAAASKGSHTTGRYRPHRVDMFRPELPGPNSPLAQGRRVLGSRDSFYKDEILAVAASVVSPPRHSTSTTTAGSSRRAAPNSQSRSPSRMQSQSPVQSPAQSRPRTAPLNQQSQVQSQSRHPDSPLDANNHNRRSSASSSILSNPELRSLLHSLNSPGDDQEPPPQSRVRGSNSNSNSPKTHTPLALADLREPQAVSSAQRNRGPGSRGRPSSASPSRQRRRMVAGGKEAVPSQRRRGDARQAGVSGPNNAAWSSASGPTHTPASPNAHVSLAESLSEKASGAGRSQRSNRKQSHQRSYAEPNDDDLFAEVGLSSTSISTVSFATSASHLSFD